MMRIGKANGCFAGFIFLALIGQNAFAGASWNENQVTQKNSSEKHRHEVEEPVQVSTGPRTPAVHIVQVRPYISHDANPGTVFIEVDQATVCNTYVYAIDMARGGSKEAYAVALTALIVDKPVVFELVNSGCSGAGTKIQSIFLSR